MIVTISMYIYIMFGIIIGIIISSFVLRIIQQRYSQKYKSDYVSCDKNLNIAIQNLKNESILRDDIEKKLQNELQNIHKLYGKLAVAEERLKLLDYYHQKYEQVNHDLNIQFNVNHDQELKLKELKVRLEEYKFAADKKEKLLVDNENRLKIQFENLANRIFSHNKYEINEQNRLILDRVLHPFREQLDIFKNQIQDNFSKEENIIHTLTYEIHNLHKLNTKITQETINLTQALKGNNKVQGNWGEVILIRALEASGMRKGYEFDIQVNIKQIDGRKLQPDVIVHLPHGKDIVIDSKVSLIAYERYFNSHDEQERRLAIIEHINSLRTHIKLLNKKEYHKLFGLNTLDYILMFIPIESAFTVAINKESSLLTDAMNCNIMLVSPTTLLVALRTINNLWRYEYQNCHAKKIAEKAGKLYDKLRLFMDDLNKIGQYLDKAEIIYNSAKNKFSEGRGNIISQAESFRELGVEIKHPILPKSHNDSSKSLLTSDNNSIKTLNVLK